MIRPAVFFTALVFSALSVAEPGKPDSGSKLEDVRARIRDVKSGIKAARDEADALQEELQQAEESAAKHRAHLYEIERDAGTREKHLSELRKQATGQQQALARESSRLGKQVRIAYMTGRDDYLKLLLNQEDPALIGRMLAYHDYFNRARLTKIQAMGQAMDDLARVQVEIQDETARLDAFRQQELAQLGELDLYRHSRREIISRIQAQISDQDRDLQRLQRNEQELSGLLERIQKKSVVAEFEDHTPFGSLKGKLSWPVPGRVVTPFGAARKGGRLRAQGVTIAATAGLEVHAVSDGRVVFADWFRNMGLLLILDHGAGYMSLYGHNEALLKKAGDLVAAGESIGRVGDTGGAEEAGLYFEIRRDGTPQDPVPWCSR